MDNLRFNRKEILKNHIYYNNLGDHNAHKPIVTKGYVKCKLMHGTVGTNVVPDLIIFEEDGEKNFKWLQPLAFLPITNIYYDDEEENSKAVGRFIIDISCNTSIYVNLGSDNYIRGYEDFSGLYSCEIHSSVVLDNYFTGIGYFDEFNVPFIKAYHHTNGDAYQKIIESGYLKLSNWNIAGTKSLKNIGYLYLTPLEEIKYDSDLVQIAMSQKGNILLRTNSGINRRVNIYRRTTKKFGSKLELYVDARCIAPSHIFKYRDTKEFVYYYICSPFILRLGANIESVFKLEENIIKFGSNTKITDYIVIGDGDYIKNIAAPYDEENTKSIFKIEKLSNGKSLFDFWWENRNTDQYTDKQITPIEF